MKYFLIVEDNDTFAQCLGLLVKEVYPDAKCDIVYMLSEIDLAKAKYDCVILDLILPDSSDPLETAKAFSLRYNGPLVACTGVTDAVVLKKITETGVDDIILKGEVDIEVLSRAISVAEIRHKLDGQMKKVL